MKNPWSRLPERPPFVYGLDEEPISELYASASPESMLHLECLPEPYLGNRDAPIVLLGLKPGFDIGDPLAHRDPLLQDAARKSLAHEVVDYPLYLLNPAFVHTPGGGFYRNSLKEVALALGAVPELTEGDPWKVIARGVFMVNYFPYHSVETRPAKRPLTSQRYSFHLAAEAVKRGALVVIVLGEKWWKEAVPELKAYGRLFVGTNTRTWTLSDGNVPGGFQAVVVALQAFARARADL